MSDKLSLVTLASPRRESDGNVSSVGNHLTSWSFMVLPLWVFMI